MIKEEKIAYLQKNRLVICPECGGEGVVDSGGQTPWGSWINVPCPLCHGKPITEQEVQEAGWSSLAGNKVIEYLEGRK